MAYSSSTVHIDIVDITYHLMQTINNEMKILVGVLFLFLRKMQIVCFYFISEAALSLAILTLVMSDAAFILIRSSWAFWFSSSPPKQNYFFIAICILKMIFGPKTSLQCNQDIDMYAPTTNLDFFCFFAHAIC